MNPTSLPAGWRVSNNTGSYSAPAAPPSDDSSSDDEGVPGLTEEDLRPDSPGWEDAEDDEVQESVKCLVCEERSGKVRELVGHCKESHQLDLDALRKRHNLDFIGTVQLINYIRHSIANGESPSTVSQALPDAWKQDQFMQPVMDEDALLYSIDELADPDDPSDPLAQEPDEPAEEAKGCAEENGDRGGEGSGHREMAKLAVMGKD